MHFAVIKLRGFKLKPQLLARLVNIHVQASGFVCSTFVGRLLKAFHSSPTALLLFYSGNQVFFFFLFSSSFVSPGLLARNGVTDSKHDLSEGTSQISFHFTRPAGALTLAFICSAQLMEPHPICGPELAMAQDATVAWQSPLRL